VKFRGESSLISKLTISDITAKINIADDATGTVNAPVAFTFSDEFSGSVYEVYNEGSPYTVSVTVEGRRK
jgi:hypothetical protein